MRSAVAAERPGGSRERPGARRARISRRAADRETPGSSTMSTRSTVPGRPRRRCAVSRSVTKRSPPAARATPESSRRPATSSRLRTPPARIATGLPGRSRCRAAKVSGRKTASPAGRRRRERDAGSTTRRSRTDASPGRSTPRSSAISPDPSSITAKPVTAGAREPIRQTKASRSSAATGTPATPVTTKSLRPDSEDAASRKDSVTLALARWIAATAATPIAIPSTGSSTRRGWRRAGPRTSARRTGAIPERKTIVGPRRYRNAAGRRGSVQPRARTALPPWSP